MAEEVSSEKPEGSTAQDQEPVTTEQEPAEESVADKTTDTSEAPEEQGIVPEDDSSQEIPEEPSEEQGVAPERDAAQESSVEPSETQEPQPQEEAPKAPEIAELETVLSHLQALSRTCEKTLEATAALEDEEEVRKRLKTYSHSLEHLLSALRGLNDFRRFLKQIASRSVGARKSLSKLRGDDSDALSSEEARILLAAATAREMVLAMIADLESALQSARVGAQALLGTIAYDGESFQEHAAASLPRIGLAAVSAVSHREESNVKVLISDLLLLQELEAHIEELSQDAQQA
jgi:hypothetical protein